MDTALNLERVMAEDPTRAREELTHINLAELVKLAEHGLSVAQEMAQEPRAVVAALRAAWPRR